MPLRAPWRTTPLTNGVAFVEDADEHVVATVSRVEDARRISCLPELRAFAQKIGAIEFPEFLDAQERLELLCDLAREGRQLVAKADGAT